MRYPFPIIEHIDDVLPAIAGREEFIRAERGDIIVLDYAVSFSDTFPDPLTAPDEETARHWALRRECRGMLFDRATGKLLVRPLHKFFNVNEREETQAGRIDVKQSHIVLEKLDGSCLRPFVLPATGRFGWATMMGETDIAKQAADFVASSGIDYEGFSRGAIDNGWSPIYEWCSRRNRIVVDHPQDRLVLTAIRNMRTGEYMSHDHMQKMAALDGFRESIPVVELVYNLVLDVQDFVADARQETEGEGYILRFDDGHMYKVKNDWYCKVHKVKEMIFFEKNVVDLIICRKLDDVIGDFPEEDQDRLTRFSDEMNACIIFRAIALEEEVAEWKTANPGKGKKEFAIEYVSRQPIEKKAFLFTLFSGELDAEEMIRSRIIQNTGTASQVESVRWLFGGLRWENY